MLHYPVTLTPDTNGTPLVSLPNAETIAAMEEARRGNLPSFATVGELLADLNAPDCAC